MTETLKKAPYEESDCTVVRLIKTFEAMGMTDESIEKNMETFAKAKKELDSAYRIF